MSNLAKYQDIVVEAARAGGVENLIKNIEQNAVAKAAPKFFVAGAAATVFLGCAAYGGVKLVADKKRILNVRSNQSKEHLKAVVDGRTDAGDANAAPTEVAEERPHGEPTP